MDALRRIKSITGQRQKVGHGGTIDPLARGVLPVCFGQATRLMDHILNSDKIYQADITLGVTTTTYDAEGEVIKTVDRSNVSQKMIEESFQHWIGIVQQTPPMYSAIKVDGQRLYKLARAGVEIKRETRPVKIHGIKVLDFDYPKLIIEVKCGKGTYIRSLAHDIGEELGCGGHISGLVRLLCGGFRSEDSITIEQLEAATNSSEGWQKHLYPLDRILINLKGITVDSATEKRLRQGQSISSEQFPLESDSLEEHRAYSPEGIFIALVRFNSTTNTWQPTKVFQADRQSPYAP